MTPAPAWPVFEARGLTNKGSYFMGVCPAHEDLQRSMTLTIGEGGVMLLKCFAGCVVQDIVEAAGVKMKDLWPPSDKRPAKEKPARVVARYDYVDELGVLLYQVERTDPKGFRQRRPAGPGGWSYKLEGVRRVLYRLPEVLSSGVRPVCLVEGEKDVENLRKLGLIATTCAGGAGAWRPEYAEALRDRTVIILPDNDDPGRQFAMQASTWIVRSLVVPLPGLADKGDVSDWIAAGGTPKQLRELAMAAALAKIVNGEKILESIKPRSAA